MFGLWGGSSIAMRALERRLSVWPRPYHPLPLTAGGGEAESEGVRSGQASSEWDEGGEGRCRQQHCGQQRRGGAGGWLLDGRQDQHPGAQGALLCPFAGPTRGQHCDAHRISVLLGPLLPPDTLCRCSIRGRVAVSKAVSDPPALLRRPQERPADKPGKAVILANSKAICLFLYKDKVYCTAGNGTAYEYPLFDSELFDAADGKPAIRCKFDQTSYYLVRAPSARGRLHGQALAGACLGGCGGPVQAGLWRGGAPLSPRARRACRPQDTGVVIEWCPKEDSPLSVRNMLSTLKKARPAEGLARAAQRISPRAGRRTQLATLPSA